MKHRIARLIEAQEPWAKPLGETAQGWLATAFARTRPAKDLLNGVWLGHPLHPLLTDVPVGALTTALLLDLAGERRAADLAVCAGVLGMAASAASGAADAVDAYGRPQAQATVHATVMSASLAAYVGSLALRAAGPASRTTAVALAMLGYGAMAAGAYVGGELVFRSGNMVDRHAWRGGGAKWRALDVAEVPEGQPVAARLESDRLVLVREGEMIHALHDTCAHAGGPLHEGQLVDGCIECPWHGSRFRISDGRVVRGPAVYDQPRFEVRRTEAGLEARLAPQSAD